MIRRVNGCRPWLLAPVVLAALATLAPALPAAAQSTGIVKGVVKDDKGKPVDGAKITIECFSSEELENVLQMLLRDEAS